MITLFLKLIFGAMKPGQVEHRRIFNKYDPRKNMTFLAISGPLDAHTLEGAKEVLRGAAHARAYPKKKAPLFDGKEEAA